MNDDTTRAHAISVADVQRISAIADPIVRNLRITQCYHEMARTLASRTGSNANWCGFATWASKQAGQTIRGEDLQDLIENRFKQSPALDLLIQAVLDKARALGATTQAMEIRRILRDVADPPAIVARASAAVARGNLKVFSEIAREFARFLAERGTDAGFDDAAIQTFCSGLHDGEPPRGQLYLRRAFARYYSAIFEAESKARAEQMFLANLEVGLHEQTRLQPEILAALNAAVIDADLLRSRVVETLFPRQAGWLGRARGLLRRTLGGPTPLDRALGALVERVRQELRLAITEHVMTLAMPRGLRLRLGTDLGSAFPVWLAQIEAPELHSFLARVDPTPDSPRASGALDWGELAERMHFITDLFRCFHASEALLDQPFADQPRIAAKAEGD